MRDETVDLTFRSAARRDAPGSALVLVGVAASRVLCVIGGSLRWLIPR